MNFQDIMATNILAQLAAVLGSFSAAFSLTALIGGASSAYLAMRRKLQAAQDKAFTEVLEKDDPGEICKYLRGVLGEFNIREYVDKDSVEARVDEIVRKLTEYLGGEEEVSLTPAAMSAGVQDGSVQRESPRDSSVVEELSSVSSEVDEDTWISLAKLRRVIEGALRRYAVARGFKERHLKSAGQILRLLRDREEISKDAFVNLDLAIRVCNRAVHGYAVEFDEVKFARDSANEGLAALVMQNHRLA